MIRVSWTWIHVAAVALSAGSVAALFMRAVPRARDAGARVLRVREEIEALRGDAARLRGLDARDADAAAAAAEGAERNAREFADWLLQRESAAAADPDPEQLATELAARFGQPKETLKALLPSRDLPGAEQAFRYVTTRDLAQSAAGAGVREIVFLIFPEDASREKAAGFGPSLPSRLVRLEYVASYNAHRSFVLGLLGRRDRGPFYAFESLQLERAPQAGAKDPLLRAMLTVRRVLPMPRTGS